MDIRILITLGPSSLKEEVISSLDQESVYLFRINLSHTPIDSLEDTIRKIQKHTKVPICLDSEGAQIRNQSMINEEVLFQKHDIVKIHYDEILGDCHNISFTPNYIVKEFQLGDEIQIDFNSACLKVIEKNSSYCLGKVEVEGTVGSNKAANLERTLDLEAITLKDNNAITIGRKMGVKHFALSFAGSAEEVRLMRETAGNNSTIISKIENRRGLFNLDGIIDESDEILIDRGDLSREISIDKIPFLQRQIISIARSKDTPVYVATNLLESMVKVSHPNRAETNDVVSTLQMGANGLVLAAETAIGKFPLEAVKMVRRLINQYEKWSPNTSISELLEY